MCVSFKFCVSLLVIYYPGRLFVQVCDGMGDPCDGVCGGGGCGVFGGPSCEKGAVTKADNALDLAKKAEILLNMKEESSRTLLTNVSTFIIVL